MLNPKQEVEAIVNSIWGLSSEDDEAMFFDEHYSAAHYVEEVLMETKCLTWRGYSNKHEVDIEEVLNGKDSLTSLRRTRAAYERLDEKKAKKVDKRFLSWRQMARGNSLLSDFSYVASEGSEHRLDNLGTLSERLFVIVDRFKELIKEGYCCQLNWSNGKDSNLLILLYILAINELEDEGFEPLKPNLLVHADTASEMPEISNAAKRNWALLWDDSVFRKFTYMVLSRPNFQQTFLGRIVAGRGIPTTVSAPSRQCAHDRKIGPNNRAVKQAIAKLGLQNAKIVLCLGSRDDEGALRKASIDKFGGSEDHLAITQVEDTNRYNFYPIRKFTTSDVWTVLGSAGSEARKSIPSILSYDEISRIYADSSGECNLFSTLAKDKAASKPCQSRHGCFDCQAVGLEDKSMASLVKKPEYDYLKLLSRIRDYIAYTHNDWSERIVINRGIDKLGYAKLQPDLYAFNKCRKILKALITADYLEEQRAADLAIEIKWGDVPRTEHNLQMARPQFQFVDLESLVLIDFLWAFHDFSNYPNEALMVWNEVREQKQFELLEEVETMTPVPPTPQPRPLYIYVGNDWSGSGSLPGLIDVMGEFVDVHAFDDDHEYRIERRGRLLGNLQHYHTMPLETDDLLAVNPEALYYYTADTDKFRAPNPTESAYDAALEYLRTGAIKIGKGKESSYHLQALRRQWWSSKGLDARTTMDDVLARKEELNLLTRQEDDADVIEQYLMNFWDEVEPQTIRMRVKKIKQSKPRPKPKPVVVSEDQFDMFE